jgi:DNA-binding SARP family transcriptional activator
MNRLEIKFLGIPSIKLNGNEIHLPFAKAEYIIFLLAYEKSMTRDKLCSFLWGDVKDEIAKKSLRNAVYTIRKSFYDNIIISPKRALLQIDDTCEIITDIYSIRNIDVIDELEENDIDFYINLYIGDFLEGIKSKLYPAFEEWISFLKNKYRKIFLENIKEIINLLIKRDSYSLCEKCCIKLIQMEEFEEIGYRNLMLIFSKQGRYGDAIKIYNDLDKILSENLSVAPSSETRKLFDNIIKNYATTTIEKKKTDFYGREKEIELLNNNFVRFLSNKEFSSYIVLGEAGVGKTRLLEEVTCGLEGKSLLIKVSCYDVESEFMFKLWDKIFESLSYLLRVKNIHIPFDIINYVKKSFPTLDVETNDSEYNANLKRNYVFMENYICDMFSIICKKEKIIFVIDDLQWADKSSLELLCKVISSNRYKIMFVSSCRSGNMSSVEKFYLNLCAYRNVSRFELSRFSRLETKQFIQLVMPEIECNSGVIYDESEGNPLFITEMMNSLKQGMNEKNITDKMAILINSRIVNLGEEARKLLTICSMFYESFDIKILSKLTGIRSIKVIDLVEELLIKNILKEEKHSDGSCMLIFTHQKIREYIYNNVSNSKRMLLHEIIGEYYENVLNDDKIDRILHPNLIFHFARANNKYKVFKYEIKGMQVILDVSHEIFPIIDDKNSSGVFEYYTDAKVLEDKFEKLKEMYEELKFQRTKEMNELGIIYLHLYGRFHKDVGNPLKGLKAIANMIELSLKEEYYKYAFEGYLQLIQHSINTNDLDLMESTIENAERIATKENDKPEFALSQRYKGYLNILKGNYIVGEKYILQALDLFSSLEDKGKYLLNIVASNFYMGESKRLQGNYKEAIKFYYQAYELCDDDEDFPALALIFSKIGYTKFELEIYDEAQFYLLKSLKSYNKTVFAWGRADVYYCLALIYDKKNLRDKSKNYIELAILFSNKYCNSELYKKSKIFLEKFQ